MNSTGNSSLCDQKVSAFLVEYKRPEAQRRFEKLATITRKECEELLENILIKGVVQGRRKSYESLERKLKDMAQDSNFRDWVSKEKNIYKHHEMGDLAGVRIGLYLPHDVLKVSMEIEKHFDMKHLFGTVTGGRDTTLGKNLDVQKHTNGPWHSRGLGGDNECWEHYGYKSWQMVVEWKKPLPEGLNLLRVEIQIGTVVTQAWAEVQHNIIYKRPADIIATPTMKRMIDAINGLAITTEIMLKELERSLEQAEHEKKEAEVRGRQPFKDGDEFADWFQSTYMSKMRPEELQDWDSPLSGASQLVNFCSRGVLDRRGRNIPMPCPNEFKKLIEEKGLLQPKILTLGGFNISDLLLRAIGYREED